MKLVTIYRNFAVNPDHVMSVRQVSHIARDGVTIRMSDGWEHHFFIDILEDGSTVESVHKHLVDLINGFHLDSVK